MVKAQISVHAWCRHSGVFSHLEKWLTPLPAPRLPIFIYSFVFRHHFWCFPFLYIKNTKHNSEKNSVGRPRFFFFVISPKPFFFLARFHVSVCFCRFSFFFFNLFSSSHLHIDKVYNILQLNKTER